MDGALLYAILLGAFLWLLHAEQQRRNRPERQRWYSTAAWTVIYLLVQGVLIAVLLSVFVAPLLIGAWNLYKIVTL